MADNKIKNVACYYRVSTKGQKDRGTIENQKSECRSYCEREGWTIVAEFEDPAVSGNSPIEERPQGSLLMERVKAGKFDAIVAVALDRLTRSEKMQERGYIYDTLGENDTAFASPMEGITYCGEFVGDVTYSLRSAMATEERKKILERQQAGRERASREARFSAGQINYGMDWDNQTKSWVINRKELATLKEAFRLIRAGTSTTEIARIFNNDLDKYPSKYAKRWTDGNVGNKFHSDFLFTGERTFKVGKNEYANHQIIEEPFFSKEEVLEVRHLLRQKKRGGPRRDKLARQANFLLHLLARCSCGGKLYIQDFTPQGKPYTYYRCKECGLRLNSKEVDKTAWSIYTEIASNEDALKKAIVEEDFITNKSRYDLEKLRDASIKRLEELRESCRRLHRAYIDLQTMEEDDYKELTMKIEKEKLQVEGDLRRAVNSINLPNEKEEAIKRAHDLIKEQVNLAEQVQRLSSPLAEMNYTEEQKEKLKEVIRKAMGFDMTKMEEQLKDEQDIEDLLYQVKRKLFDDLILAGGKVTVSQDGIVINGIVRLGEDDFKEQILGQSSFG
jgi:DNA invertase Pin-like site-specific DNA recombinase